MSKKAVKLVAFDLDGTLLNDRKTFPEPNLRALRAAADAGWLLVPATGRILKGLPEELLEMEAVRYCILSNGAVIYDRKEARKIHEAGLSPDLAMALCDYMDDLPVLYDCYRDDRGYMSERFLKKAPDFMRELPELLEMVLRLRKPVPDLKEEIRREGKLLEKMQMFFRPEDDGLRLSELKSLPLRFPELLVSSSTPINVEINSAQAGKGRALKRLCALLGMEEKDSIAFGDGLNDQDMLRCAGLGCAMENASEEVRRCADRVIGGNNEGGLGKELLRLLEEEA